MYSIKLIKEQIPYKTQVEINGKIFNLEISYNIYDEKIYLSLYDENNNLLVEDEPIIMGQIMFARYYIDAAGNFRNEFPKAIIIPNFYDNSIKDKLTYDNIDKWALFVEEI